MTSKNGDRQRTNATEERLNEEFRLAMVRRRRSPSAGSRGSGVSASGHAATRSHSAQLVRPPGNGSLEADAVERGREKLALVL